MAAYAPRIARTFSASRRRPCARSGSIGSVRVRPNSSEFVISAVLQEGIVFAALLRFSGWMGAFFLVQGALVLGTSHPRVRAWSQAHPRASWALTLLAMAITGVMFVRGGAGIEPSDSWLRCCGS